MTVRRRNPVGVAVQGGAQGWQRQTYTILAAQGPIVLPTNPASDGDGDPLVRVEHEQMAGIRGRDFSVAGATVTWINADVPLEEGEHLEIWYVPAA